MGNISKHLSLHEFRCKCKKCQFNSIEPIINRELVVLIELILAHYECKLNTRCKVIINSGNRCKAHNKKVGGATHSKHISGKGADCVFKSLIDGVWVQIEPVYIMRFIDSIFPDSYGVKNYYNPKRNHIDVRKEKWRG